MDYIYIWSGLPKHERAKRGVAILIHKSHQKNIIDWTPVSDRIIQARIKIKGAIFFIMGVYALTEDKLEIEKDDFFDKVLETIELKRSNEELYLLGDSNGRISSKVNSNVTDMACRHCTE